MVYLSGVTDHHVQDGEMIDHIVKLVEAKAAEIDAGTSVSMDVLHGKAA
jgi:(E)-4-hydroxy-3-methylbut-2-enyl-diphosphate synthase